MSTPVIVLDDALMRHAAAQHRAHSAARPVWVIHRWPLFGFAARLYTTAPNIVATEAVITGDTLEAVRAHLPDGLTRHDDPTITPGAVETWR